MKLSLTILLSFFIFLSGQSVFAGSKRNVHQQKHSVKIAAYIDAADFGFLPTESGANNTAALQKALNKGGTIVVSRPGTYKVAGTDYIGDNTSLVFENSVIIQKSAENGVFTHVFLNKGALERKYNYNISVTGLNLQVNGVDKWMDPIYGLRGHVSFFYVKGLSIEHFRCVDVAKGQFCLQICTFEDLLINDVIIKGNKDGIHLGRGKRFKISNAILETGDDAIALAAGDWVSGNPEYGDLENGVIENCTDLKAGFLEGGFAKIVAAGWVDWKPGMEVRHADAVVSNGKIYRVVMPIDGKIYKTLTRPDFEKGMKEIDGINWLMYQTDTIHTAVVKNVIFRDIFLESVRIPFQLTCYDVNYAHSYYRGARIPVQENITLDNIMVLNDAKRPLVSVSSPCDMITIRNSTFSNNSIAFTPSRDFDRYPKTYVNLSNCIFKNAGHITLLSNRCNGKEIYLQTTGSIETGAGFSASIEPGSGNIHVSSDLTGLKN